MLGPPDRPGPPAPPIRAPRAAGPTGRGTVEPGTGPDDEEGADWAGDGDDEDGDDWAADDDWDGEYGHGDDEDEDYEDGDYPDPADDDDDRPGPATDPAGGGDRDTDTDTDTAGVGRGGPTRAFPTFDDTAPPPPLPPRRPPGPPRMPPRVPRAVLLKQRRRRRRFIIGLTFFLSASVTLVGSGAVYLQYRLGQIERVDVPSLVEDQPGQVMNVLLVGSDSRDRLEGRDALQAGKGQVSGQRSDTIMVLHIDPEQEQAAILSIPRDLYLPIAGESYSDRVNAAFSLGGAQRLIETIQQSLGITVNHYVEVDFVGFKDIVDAVGGVRLYLPNWVRDFTSGLDLHQTGCVTVDGTQGLAWVRSRNFEYLLEDGLTWVSDPRADLGRIERQQEFIRRMLKKALSSGLTNPIQLNRLIGIGVRDVTLDETLSTKDITTLARRFNNLDADSVALYTLPTVPADIDGASVLVLVDDQARPYVDVINGVDGATIPVPGASPAPATTVPAEELLYPDGVDIRVLNGEGTVGAAARAAIALESAGFTVSGTGDAPETSRTAIRHASGALAHAQLLDRALAGGADLVVDETVTSTDVVLVLGADYDGLAVGPVSPVPRPTTTVTTAPAGAAAAGPSTTAGAGATSSTTSTLPPTTLGPTTLPPGVEC